MSEFNPSQFLATRLRTASDLLIEALGKMPHERITWKPATEGNEGRDALDQILECAYINELAVAMFRDHAVHPVDWADYQQKLDANRTKDQAELWLMKSTNQLAMALAGFPEHLLASVTQNPFTKEPASWAEISDFVYWNMIYHHGQICYIQTLYGDRS